MSKKSFPSSTDPLPGYRFIVSLNNILMGFQKITGMKSQIETETIREGGLNTRVHVLPKSCSAEQILRLEKGIYAGQINPLCLVGQKIPGVLNVMVMDNQRKPLKTYLFTELIVKSWEVGEMSADQNGILVDHFEISYEDFQMVR